MILIPPLHPPYTVIHKFGDPMNYGKGITPHKGWDFAKLKDPSRPFSYDNILEDWTGFSPADGKIIEKRWSTSGGNIYTMDIGEGFRVWLAHFKKQFNTVGTELMAGDPIGIAGTTPGLPWSGYVHIHLQLYKNGVVVDPAPYIKENTMAYKINSIYYSKADKEYYWIKSDGSILFIPHERLTQATAMQIGTTIEESLKDKIVGNF